MPLPVLPNPLTPYPPHPLLPPHLSLSCTDPCRILSFLCWLLETIPGKYLGSWPDKCSPSLKLSVDADIEMGNAPPAVDPATGEGSTTGLAYDWDWDWPAPVPMIEGDSTV